MSDKRHKRVIKKGAAIYTSGTPSGTIYIIEKGEVSLEGSGRQELMAPGDILGAFDSLLRTEYSKTALALTPCTVTLFSASEQLEQLKGSLSMKLVESLLTKTDQVRPGYWS